jgi:hypothetical protein
VSTSYLLPNFRKQNYLDMFANQRKTKYEGTDVQKRQARDTAAETQIQTNNK